VELLTSDEFARWFTSLDERAAEDAAATLEVIVQLGTEKEAPGSSEWLTWYEHPSLSTALAWSSLAGPADPSAISPAFVRFIDEWGAFHIYVKRVVKHLESQSFVARATELDPRGAMAVRDAVARIKKTVTRRSLAFSDLQVKRRLRTHAPTAREAVDLARLVDIAEVREAYLAALAAAGFSVVDVPAHSPALREIMLRAPPPGFRLLYGVDSPKNRALVVLGEALDRSFYGDSVRRAERVWQEFLHGELSAEPAKAR
jgi:hypothetical protein